MGDLARHVAEIVRRRHPDSAIPPDMADQFAEMGMLAERAARNVARTIAAPRDEQFAQRERDDDRIDQLHRDILTAVHRPAPGFSVRTGIDVALLARFFERFADQAVSVTRRLDYIITGAVPERPAAG
jgi:Phosphate uptake regulator